MDIKEIKELIELIRDTGVEEFEMEKAGVRLRVRNSKPSTVAVGLPALPVAAEVAALPAQAAPAVQLKEEENLHIFRAPIVGTFYITPKPDAEALVEVGDRVNQSTVVCIIEAMKIFNQIECDVVGEVVEILVENGQPVEYGEPLMKIRV